MPVGRKSRRVQQNSRSLYPAGGTVNRNFSSSRGHSVRASSLLAASRVELRGGRVRRLVGGSLGDYAEFVSWIEDRNRESGYLTHPYDPSPRTTWSGADLQACPTLLARCRKPVPEDPWLSTCPLCGDHLLPQGYCPICEDYWRLPVGTACPKHDHPLDAMGPPSPRLDAGDKPFTWVTVSRFTDSLAAEAPRIRLEAEGIPTFVEGQRMGSRSMYHVATGGVRLKVPEDLAGEARIILSQTWSATAAELGIEEDHEDGDDESLAELPQRDPGKRPITPFRDLVLPRCRIAQSDRVVSLAAPLERPLKRVQAALRVSVLRAGRPATGP